MAYDEDLAERVRHVLGSLTPCTEKKMFGGLAYMVRGNMAAGIVKHDLMVRVGPEKYELALSQPFTRPMEFTGRVMKGMVFVAPEGVDDLEDLRRWVKMGVDFCLTLPAK